MFSTLSRGVQAPQIFLRVYLYVYFAVLKYFYLAITYPYLKLRFLTSTHPVGESPTWLAVLKTPHPRPSSYNQIQSYRWCCQPMSSQHQAALSLVSSCFGLVWFGDYVEPAFCCASACACVCCLSGAMCNSKCPEKCFRYMYCSKEHEFLCFFLLGTGGAERGCVQGGAGRSDWQTQKAGDLAVAVPRNFNAQRKQKA